MARNIIDPNTPSMKKLTQYKALMTFIEQESCFRIIEDRIGCLNCTKTFIYRPKEGVAPLKVHLKTISHIRNTNKNGRQTILELSKFYPGEENRFDINLLDALTSANIPISKLENEKFKLFLSKYCQMNVKSEFWYRKNLLEVVASNKNFKIINKLKNKPIYCIFDEKQT